MPNFRFQDWYCISKESAGVNGRYVRFQQSLYMDLWGSQEDYGGSLRLYKLYKKQQKHTLFIYSKTRTRFYPLDKLM